MTLYDVYYCYFTYVVESVHMNFILILYYAILYILVFGPSLAKLVFEDLVVAGYNPSKVRHVV